MGMYTGLRFKGIVKKRFREKFTDIALNGDWESSKNPTFRKYSMNDRAGFIPCGILCYMPDEWETEDKNGEFTPTDGFETTYDAESGRWTFQCSLKNYSSTIDEFLDMIPYFIEELEIAEVYYEEWDWSTLYKLKDNELVVSTRQYRKYKN